MEGHADQSVHTCKSSHKVEQSLRPDTGKVVQLHSLREEVSTNPSASFAGDMQFSKTTSSGDLCMATFQERTDLSWIGLSKEPIGTPPFPFVASNRRNQLVTSFTQGSFTASQCNGLMRLVSMCVRPGDKISVSRLSQHQKLLHKALFSRYHSTQCRRQGEVSWSTQINSCKFGVQDSRNQWLSRRRFLPMQGEISLR